MFGAIFVMVLAPWLDTSSVRSGRYRPSFKWWFWLLGIDFIVLMWCGAMPAEGIYGIIALIGAFLLVRIFFNNSSFAWHLREAFSCTNDY